jgi:rRNA pseudouridine-1189 N-methylase Emg1 (Nep1/Mra1 family)
MACSIIDSVQEEIVRQEGDYEVKLPKDYEQAIAMYSSLLERGIARKRESQLRSISDPFVEPNEPLYRPYLN